MSGKDTGWTSAGLKICKSRSMSLESGGKSSTLTEWKVPLATVDAGPDEIEAAAQVIRSRWLAMGPITEQFETEFGRYHCAKQAVAVSNGTAALHLAYLALGVGAGDEVIMPSLTFVATASAAVACGAKPVFAEIIGDNEP